MKFIAALLLASGVFARANRPQGYVTRHKNIIEAEESPEGVHLLLAAPQGVCEGVVRAIDTVETAIQLWGAPIYVKHEIVHNQVVCDNLRKKGAIFIEDLNEIPIGQKVVFSAHGVPPETFDIAKSRKLTVIDATCPLVSKVHNYVKKAASQGAQILLVGHKDHIEVQGVAAEAPDVVTIIEDFDDLAEVDFAPNTKIFYASQTTLSLDDVRELTEAIKKKFPQAETIPSGSICFATTNRQTALEACLPDSDVCFVVGDPMSSNAVKLVDLGNRRGVPTYLIRGKDDIDPTTMQNVKTACLTAGASSPPYLIEEVKDRLVQLGVKSEENRVVAEEDFRWKLPRTLEAEIQKRRKAGEAIKVVSIRDRHIDAAGRI